MEKLILVLSDLKRLHFSERDVEPRCGTEGLKNMIVEAYELYQKEVLGSIKSYERYSEDFVNSHVYCDSIDAWSKNEHNKNLGTVSSLLFNRYDIVQRFFTKKELTENDLSEIIKLIENSSIVRRKKRGETMTSNVLMKEIPDFGCNLDEEGIGILVRYANKLQLFKSKVTIEEMKSLLACSPKKKMISNNNGFLALFFHSLSSRQIIIQTWQHVISSRELIYSSNGRELLTQRRLSSALYQYGLKRSSKKEKILFNMLDALTSKNKKKK